MILSHLFTGFCGSIEVAMDATGPPPLILPDRDAPVVLWRAGHTQTQVSSPQAVLPGSFNPLHSGHRQLRQTAAKFLGCEVTYELSIRNVDKPRLSTAETQRRLAQINAPILLTEAPLFTQKADLFPGACFVIGFDTAERLLDEKYYRHSSGDCTAALGHLLERECRFLVAGRLISQNEESVFARFPMLRVRPDFASMFEELPEEVFRADISSTDLRNGRAPTE